MTIQVGDQVYHRGHVWTVVQVNTYQEQPDHLALFRSQANGGWVVTSADAPRVQRVEQVR